MLLRRRADLLSPNLSVAGGLAYHFTHPKDDVEPTALNLGGEKLDQGLPRSTADS